MTDAKNHHWVPQCYLKRFTRNRSKNSQLAVRDLVTGKSFISSPRGVGAKRDFNRVESLERGAVENALSGFEGRVGGAIAALEERKSIAVAGDSWLVVVNLMALLAVRNPRMRENRRKFIEQLSKMSMDLALDSKERFEASLKGKPLPPGIENVSYEELKRFHKSGKYTIDVAQAWHIGIEFESVDRLIPALLARKWVLLGVPDGSHGFITCDHPVCLFHSDGSLPTLDRPVGYGVAQTTLLFPISTNLLAVGRFEEPITNPFVRISEFQVAYFNAYQLAFAERQLYARDFDASCFLFDKTGRFGDIPNHDDILRARR